MSCESGEWRDGCYFCCAAVNEGKLSNTRPETLTQSWTHRTNDCAPQYKTVHWKLTSSFDYTDNCFTRGLAWSIYRSLIRKIQKMIVTFFLKIQRLHNIILTFFLKILKLHFIILKFFLWIIKWHPRILTFFSKFKNYISYFWLFLNSHFIILTIFSKF